MPDTENKKSPGEAFGIKPDALPEPEDFDVDAWLDESSLPERLVEVAGDGKGFAELQKLQQEYESQLEDDDGESLASAGARESFRREYEELRQRVEKSKKTFLIRAATLTQIAEVKKGLPEDASEMDIAIELLAVQCAKPKLTAEQAKRLGDKIGPGQLEKMIRSANEATFSYDVDIPTLPASLQFPETRG